MNHKRLLLEHLIRLQWYGHRVKRCGISYCLQCNRSVHHKVSDVAHLPFKILRGVFNLTMGARTQTYATSTVVYIAPRKRWSVQLWVKDRRTVRMHQRDWLVCVDCYRVNPFRDHPINVARNRYYYYEPQARAS